MYHIRLVKGMSYSGAVTATRKNPDVFTEDEVKYASAMESGYFADLTGTGDGTEPPDGGAEAEGSKEPDAESKEEGDAFSGMTVDELKAYAEANGIILDGAKKKADIISVIRGAEAKAAEARSILREQ